MPRQRDSQRTKVISILDSIDPGADFQSLAEVQKYVDRITSSAWWRKNAVPRTFAVRGDYLGPEPKNRLTFRTLLWIEPERANQLGILRSIAARSIPPEAARHGLEYRQFLLGIVGRFMGVAKRKEIRQAFLDNDIKLSTWSNEAKERAKHRSAQRDLQALLEELS